MLTVGKDNKKEQFHEGTTSQRYDRAKERWGEEV